MSLALIRALVSGMILRTLERLGITSGGAYSPVDPARRLYEVTDWLANSSAGEHNWGAQQSGTGAGSGVLSAETASIGVGTLATGTTTTGTAGLRKGNPRQQLLGGVYVMEARVRLPVLATTEEAYAAVVGWGVDATPSVLGFSYSQASANWHFGGSDTGVAATANTWTTLRAEVSPTRRRAWVNGVLVHSSDAAPPSDDVAPHLRITKSAGTTARTLELDYVLLDYQFPNGRP